MNTDVNKPSHLTGHRFDEFNLKPELLTGLEAMGFSHCTQIQAETLPLALTGIDIAGQAQTGTGKTAAFLLAMFQKLLDDSAISTNSDRQLRAVILAPTRELAMQIHRDAKAIGAHTGLRLGLVYGGTGYQQQRNELANGVDVLIGTPGRLIDYFKQGLFTLKNVEVVVLDEADRMFDLGFIKDIRYVLRRMPPPNRRLNMLFSATLSYRIRELAYEHMNDPHMINIAATALVADGLSEQVYYPANNEKLNLLVGVMKQIEAHRVLVFANTRFICDQVGQHLLVNGYATGVLSGDVPQKKRERLLDQFKEGKKQILVATDVAARGLHIPHVSHVFNYDLPQDPEDYVHRIGRTARAGASGYAISFACEEHALSLIDIEEFIGHQLTRMEISENLLAPIEAPPKRPVANKPKARKHQQKTGSKKVPAHNQAKQLKKPSNSLNPNNKIQKQYIGDTTSSENQKALDKPSTFARTTSKRRSDIPAVG